MKKILFVGDYSAPTGFGQVLENIIKNLYDKFDITVLACNYTCSLPINTFNGKVKVYMARSNYGLAELPRLIRHINPDVVFTLNDGYIMPQYYAVMQNYIQNISWVSYVVFDGEPVDPKWGNFLRYIDKVIVPTKWQKDLLEGRFLPYDAVSVIPHGFDPEIYSPADEKDFIEYRKQILKNVPKSTDDTFIVGMIAKNFNRKRWPEAIQAFAHFNETVCKDSVFLCYTTHGFSTEEFDLNFIANTFGVGDKVVLLGDAMPLSDEKMNALYNAFDLNMLLSIGEGFGLPTLYASAVGKHTIVYDNSVQEELSHYIPGSIVADANPEIIIFPNDGGNNVRKLPNIHSVKKHMTDIYRKKDELRTYERREGISLKTRELMQWSNFIPEFEYILEKAANYNKKLAVI